MTGRTLLGAVGAWVALLVIMFVNGTGRVLVLQPRFGEDPARRVASLIGVGLVTAFSYLYVRLSALRASRELLLVGVLWLGLTLSFEFGFGRASGRSWPELLADYDLARGRLWPLVLVATLLSPWAWGMLLARNTVR
ncbi:MAG TPA: hypothetical protein VEQ10_04120 [Vicinamibacteria bacterium]|nr:hypothetical protein [Vicinamibacteria bacterium]